MVTTRGKILAAVLCGLILSLQPVRGDDSSDAIQRKALSLNTVTGDDPIQGKIKQLVADAAGTKKLLAEAVKMAKGKDQPFTYNASLILAQTAQKLKDFETSTVFYRICVEQAVKLLSGKKLAESYIGYIDMLRLNGKDAEVVKASREFLEIPDDAAALKAVREKKGLILEEMLRAMARSGQFAEAMKLIERLEQGQPEDLSTLLLRGDVEREAGKLEEAAKTLEKVIEQIGKSPKLEKEQKTKLRQGYQHLLSSVYIDMKQLDKATQVLQSLLKEEPNHPTYNNDLGYIWADHDMNLDESEKLIRKALEEDRKQRKENAAAGEDDKDNAAYLDSLGWVLFKKKKFQDAKKYLAQAVQDEDGQHVEIMDHLADVHMALGEKAEAINVWKKALELTTPGRREQQKKAEVEKKLKQAQDN